MASKYDGDFMPSRVKTLKTVAFRGINHAVDESKLSVNGECFTPKSINTAITGGNLTVRNNYVEVTPTTATADMNDGYTYLLRRLMCHAATEPGASKLLALAEAQSGGVFHHYCLLARKMDLTDTWAEVKSASTHALGTTGDSIWFNNANMSFANYSGDFMETGPTMLATMLSNGYDTQAFYRPSTGLHVLGYYGWKNVTVNPTTNVLTATGLVTADDTVEFYSRTQEMPGGVEAFKIYYAVNVSGNSFKISLTQGGSAIDITSAGANVIGRLNKDMGAWGVATVDTATSRITNAEVAKAAYVMFAQSDTLPRGVWSNYAYKVINVSGSTFQIALRTSADPITLPTAGSNVRVRPMTLYPADPPRGSDITIHEERAWAFIEDTLYHNAGFYDSEKTEAWDGKAHPNDWYTAELSGNLPKPTWDGDTLVALRSIGGRLLAFKRNSLFEITGNRPPFGLRQVQNATGTIARNSICDHPLYGIFWATPTGIVRFNGANTEPYLVDEISGLWSADNANCWMCISGDSLYFCGNLKHPETGVKGAAIMMVDLPSKNVNYWTLALGESTLTVDCVLDPRFTTVEDKAKAPEFWFASGGKVYKYSLTTPAAGAAVPMTYWEPQTDYGDAMTRKRVSRMQIDGSGGTLTVTPHEDGVARTAKTIELPRKQPVTISCNGRKIGFKYSSTDDPVVGKNVTREYS